MSITPYISPEQQQNLDSAALLREEERFLLLADDFCDKTLINMMHGVVEIRWEETIKRDIPKPEFLDKIPEELSQEEKLIVKDYEDKVEVLTKERLKYKNMLETEYAETSQSIRRSVKKFNEQLRDLLLLKLKVESARKQEVLKAQNLQLYAMQRIELKEKEEEVLKEIKVNEEKTAFIIEQLQTLERTNSECKNVTEMLLSKEKQLKKHFEKDFSDYSNLIQSQILKLYK